MGVLGVDCAMMGVMPATRKKTVTPGATPRDARNLLRSGEGARALQMLGDRWCLLILRDGDLGEPEVLLSPLIYVWTHAARIEVYSAAGDLDAHMDALLGEVANALGADPTLGGLIDLMDTGAPDFDGAAPEGGPDIKAAIVAVRLTYETTHPLT